MDEDAWTRVNRLQGMGHLTHFSTYRDRVQRLNGEELVLSTFGMIVKKRNRLMEQTEVRNIIQKNYTKVKQQKKCNKKKQKLLD